MRYLNEQGLHALQVPWKELVDVIRRATLCLHATDYAQPLKPYLRFGDPRDRIIAMPAYVGGDFRSAGIKWIASFPRNLERGIPRASSVVILNSAETGQPTAVINGAYLSVMRTAAVSGLVLQEYLQTRPRTRRSVGITGWGPIGRAHAAMARELLGNDLGELRIFDLRPDTVKDLPPVGRAVGSWEEAYDVDVFMTCTVASTRYVNRPPRPASLHLNVSLRDYTPEMLPHFRQRMIVDDWVEVCRENTDVELFHKTGGLAQNEALTLADVVANERFRAWSSDEPVMFNPMGMAVYDIAVAAHLVDLATKRGLGQELA